MVSLILSSMGKPFALFMLKTSIQQVMKQPHPVALLLLSMKVRNWAMHHDQDKWLKTYSHVLIMNYILLFKCFNI